MVQVIPPDSDDYDDPNAPEIVLSEEAAAIASPQGTQLMKRKRMLEKQGRK